MGAETKIEWCDATFNPWRGCQKVSPGCANCYAEAASKRNPRVQGEWGANGFHVVAAESTWLEPIAWNKQAAADGRRRRVFCASLADVFEDHSGEVRDHVGHVMYVGTSGQWLPDVLATGGNRPLRLADVRDRLFAAIAATPYLDWLLLTKRIEDWGQRLDEVANQGQVGADFAQRWLEGQPPPNIWLGVSVEDQERARQRISALQEVPAVLHFLSCEPLLGPLDFSCCPLLAPERGGPDWPEIAPIDWVIVGGESGAQARPCHIDWIRAILAQCRDAGVACFVKQLGSQPVASQSYGPQHIHYPTPHGRYRVSVKELTVEQPLVLRDPKGGDPEEWPEDLRVRDLPVVSV